MPYLPPDLQDPRLKQPTLGQALAQGTGATAPIGVAGGGSSAGQVGPQPTPAGGSGFVNLSQYLGANQGAGQQMGQSIADTFRTPTIDATMPNPISNPMRGHTKDQPYDPYAPAYTDAQKGQAQTTLDGLTTAHDPRSVGALVPGSTEGGKGLDAYLLGTTGMAPINKAWDDYSGALQKVAGYSAPERPPAPPPRATPNPTHPGTPYVPAEPPTDYGQTVSGLSLPNKAKKVMR